MRSISPSIALGSTEAMARRPAIWRSSASIWSAGRQDTINAFGPGLLRYQRQPELLAHHTRKKAADRVLLPTRRLHDGGDRCALGLSKQGEDGLLFGPAAGRTPGNVPRLRRSVRAALGARKLGLCGDFAVRHVRILFGCDGTRRRHHRSPAVAASPAGQDPDRANRPLSRHGIQQAIWLYLRFTLSLRDVEDLLAERGIMVSYETVRRWVNHFGPMIAADCANVAQAPHDLAFG